MLRTRILTGLVLGVVVAASVFLLDTVTASLIFAFFWLVGTIEWSRLAAIPQHWRAVYGAAFAAIVAAVLLLNPPGQAMQALLWLAALLWAVAFVLVLRYPRPLINSLVAAAGIVVLTAAWVSFYLLHRVEESGPALILSGLVIIWSADIGAYFVGRRFGRRRLAPVVSPKKTWEGVAGGLAAAVLVAAISARLIGLPYGAMLVLGIGVAMVSIVGDLGVSMLKRHAGLKDSGMLLPGHGGVLDRFDGVTAGLPVYVLGLQFAHVLD